MHDSLQVECIDGHRSHVITSCTSICSDLCTHVVPSLPSRTSSLNLFQCRQSVLLVPCLVDLLLGHCLRGLDDRLL